MRIACLQFAPQLGDVDQNLNRADAVLSKANPKDIDLLVLPELAFSGYNFKSLKDISPYLESTAVGISAIWARTTALKYNCVVIVGYPEKVDISPKWPASPEYYSSAITVNKEGEIIANYRKSFLYYTDETWASEGPDGFYDGVIEGLGNVAMGICMDLNPYKFEAPWSAWEFAYHILHKQANIAIISMAWITRENARSYSRAPKEPDMETLAYWVARLEPLIRGEDDGEVIVVLANRSGAEGDATYAGTSAVLGIQSGAVKLYGILGRGERELLVVDTSKRPQAKLVSDPSIPARAAGISRETGDASMASQKSQTKLVYFSTTATSRDIVQLIDFVTEVLARLDNFQYNHLKIQKAFRHIKAELPLLQETLKQTKHKIDHGAIKEDSTILPAVQGCKIQIEALDGLLDETLLVAGDSRSKETTQALWSITQDSKVESIMKTLRGYISTLTFYHAAMSSMLQPMKDTKLVEIRRWLSPPNPSINYRKALKLRQPNTGLWFLESEVYSKWKTNASSFIWLYGIPGCGKTILGSTVTQDILLYCANDPGKVVAYFYFDFADADKQKPKLMVRSLISQLSEQCIKMPLALEALYSSCDKGNRQPSLNALMIVLQQMLQEFPQSYLILDALDECADRPELLIILEQIAGWQLEEMRVLVTSRKERDIESSLEKIVNRECIICLQHQVVDKDIQTYVRQRLSDDKGLKKWQKDAEIRREIEATLMEGSRGMFKWAVCQMDTLGKCRTRLVLQKALKALPATLDETYERILCTISDADSEYAIRIFRCLIFSSRPLLVEELAKMVAINMDRETAFDRHEVVEDPMEVLEDPMEVLEDPMEVLDICKNLVSVSTISRTVTFTHHSVQDYLISTRIYGGRAARYGIRPMMAPVAQTLERASKYSSPQAQRPANDDFPALERDDAKESIEQQVKFRGAFSDSGFASMPASVAPKISHNAGQTSIHDNHSINQLSISTGDQGSNQNLDNEHTPLAGTTEAADEDLQSVVSDRDEVFSQISIRKTQQELLAEKRLTILLAQHEDLKPLYEIALERVGKERFVNNFRRILKRYYLDLVQSANTNLEQATVHLLRSRWTRVKIAQDIVNRVKPESDELYGQPLDDTRDIEDKMAILESWIASNPGLAPPLEPQDIGDEVELTSDSDQDDDEQAFIGYPLPNIAEMESFLFQGNSFCSLITNTSLFLLPAALSPISRVLMTIPYERVYFSSENNLSVLNWVKGFIEDHTEEIWNWWPLQPRMRPLAKDQMRVYWKCHCGNTQWAEISRFQADSYQSILQRNRSTSQNNHLCRSRRGNPWRVAFRRIITKVPGLSKPQASTTKEITQVIGLQSTKVKPSGDGIRRAANIPHNSAGPASNSQNEALVNFNEPPRAKLYVLFGVKGSRRTLELEQIEVNKHSDDNSFFQSLRLAYRKHRGFWRYWFSIWQLNHCDFVKFLKLRANRIIFHSKSLPEESIYEYRPRPPTAEDPPILPHEFELAFSACSSNCPLSTLHECIEPPIGTFAVERIPKRKTMIEIFSNNSEPSWGIQAQHAISALRVVLYHLVIFAGTFGFWAWWLATHPSDLQNAAVPLTTVAMLLSLFWGSAGILKFRERGLN